MGLPPRALLLVLVAAASRASGFLVAAPQRRDPSLVRTRMAAAPDADVATAGPTTTATSRGAAGQGGASRRDVLGGALGLVGGAALGLAAAGMQPAPANAWCGKPYPSWAYRLRFNDGLFPVTINGKKCDLFLRVVGDDGQEKKKGHLPIILVPGGPGLTHDYLETLEPLAAGDRRVITFDPIGVGQSSRALPDEKLTDPSLGEEEALRRWSALVVEQLRAIVDFLELGDHHVLGHGAGAIPALQYAAVVTEARAGNSSLPAVKSLTLASPFVLAGGWSVTKPYKAAGMGVPLCVTESVDGAGKVPALTKLDEARDGPYFDDRWVGLLAGDFERLGGVPTYVSYGAREDALDAAAAQKIAERVPGDAGVVRRFEGVGHLAHIDRDEVYVDWVDEQLQRAEGSSQSQSQSQS